MKNIFFLAFFIIACSTSTFADLKADYKSKVASGDIDPTETSFDKFQSMQAKEPIDFKKLYKEKIASGEIDPTTVSFQDFQSKNSAGQKKETSNVKDSTSADNNQEHQANDEDVFVKPSNVFPDMSKTAGGNIEKEKDKYLAERGLRLGYTVKGSHLAWGMANIGLSPSDISFAAQRIMKFEEAKIIALGNYAKSKEVDIAKETMRELFNDNKDDNVIEAKLADKIKREEEFEKKMREADARTLAGAISKAMDKMVSPQEIEKMPEQNRIDLIKKSANTLSRKIAIQSRINASGSRVLATFQDTKSVGVLVLYSPDQKKLADMIAGKRIVSKGFNENPSKSIAEKIRAEIPTDTEFIKEYGVRILEDSLGNPVIVSFGISAPKVTNVDSTLKRNHAIQAAKVEAGLQAYGQMADFANTTVTVDAGSDSLNDETIKDVYKNGKMDAKDQEMQDVNSAIKETLKQKSTLKINGDMDIFNWQANDPITGHPLVGVVKMWSPNTQILSEGKMDKLNPNKSDKEASGQVKKKDSIKKSADLGEKYDF